MHFVVNERIYEKLRSYHTSKSRWESFRMRDLIFDRKIHGEEWTRSTYHAACKIDTLNFNIYIHHDYHDLAMQVVKDFLKKYFPKIEVTKERRWYKIGQYL